MNNNPTKHLFRSVIWLSGALVFFLSLVGSPIVGYMLPYDFGWERQIDPVVYETMDDLKRLELLGQVKRPLRQELIQYRRETGLSLAEILRDPKWVKKLGLNSDTFKVTWYMANPFDVLPPYLQEAIKQKEIPFDSRMHVWQWCRIHNVEKKYRKALYAALIETTPHNLWRASRGKRPYAKNGEFLEPIVIEDEKGNLTLQNGHIATDPSVIPTNSEVLLLVKIQGKDHVLKVKAADIGGAIKGHHIDLPIHVGSYNKELPHTRLPKHNIRNHTAQILSIKRS